MTDLKDARGFEDVWRQLRYPARITPQTLQSPRLREALMRLTSHAPTPVVSHIGAPKTIGQLKQNLNYISRDGRLPLEGPDGTWVVGKAEIKERCEEWAADRYFSDSQMSLAHSFVASMPPGTPPQHVFDAASDFFAARFEDTSWLMARHDDEPHPHVHVSVRAQDDEGRQQHFDREDLDRMREAFAVALRSRGIEAEAAPRWARGVAEKARSRRVYALEASHIEGRAAEPRYIETSINEAFDIARGRSTSERPWEARIKSTQQQVREGYLKIADELARTGLPQDRVLADRLHRYVAMMPAPLTRRELLVEEARSIDRAKALERDAAWPWDQDRELSR